MPFTTSHPAIILPLKRMFPGLTSLSGLMAGAMAPDLIYFLMGTTINRNFTHSWSGMFIFDIPAGILFAFAFHWLFKRVFLESLPFPLDRFFSGLAASRFEVAGWKAWLVLVASVAIGVLSHFFWDSFTHAQGQLTWYFPILLERREIFGQQIQICRIAQHVSTAAGALFILLYLVSGLLIPPATVKYRPRPARDKIRIWLLGIVGSAAAMVLGKLLWLTPNGLQHFIEHNASGPLIVYGLSSWAGFFWVICLVALVTSRHAIPLPGNVMNGDSGSGAEASKAEA